jgi:ADP-ribosylglycohydrolase
MRSNKPSRTAARSRAACASAHDTDTTAAIAGGLAGIRWALDDHEHRIPGKWLSALRGQDIVEGMLRRLLAD